MRSVYSDDVFPVGWCNKHKYSLSTPKLPFTDCDDYKTMYYASDIDIDFNQSDNNYLEKYPNFVKGEIFYHYSKKYAFFIFIFIYIFFINFKKN